MEGPQFYASVHNSKNTLATALLLMLPWFGMICLMGPTCLNSCLFQKKVKVVSLQKGIPNLAYTLSGVSMVLDLATAMDR